MAGGEEEAELAARVGETIIEKAAETRSRGGLTRVPYQVVGLRLKGKPF